MPVLAACAQPGDTAVNPGDKQSNQQPAYSSEVPMKSPFLRTAGAASASSPRPSPFRRVIVCGLALVLPGLGSGCASLVSGRQREVTFTSKPEGAKLTVVDTRGVTVAEGLTPFTASLRKAKAYFAGQRYVLTFHKNGYYDMQQDLEGTVSSWYFGNFLFGGVVGFLVVDPHTGAMYTFPKEISARLTPTAVNPTPDGPQKSED
jgi:hypothetical protein